MFLLLRLGSTKFCRFSWGISFIFLAPAQIVFLLCISVTVNIIVLPVLCQSSQILLTFLICTLSIGMSRGKSCLNSNYGAQFSRSLAYLLYEGVGVYFFKNAISLVAPSVLGSTTNRPVLTWVSRISMNFFFFEGCKKSADLLDFSFTHFSEKFCSCCIVVLTLSKWLS